MRDLTEGSIPRHITSMAAFMTMGMIFQTLYYLIDLYFVAGLGPAALAGVSAAGSATFLMLATGHLISVGALSLISNAAGAKDWESANTAFNQALGLSLIMAAGALVLGLAAIEPAMKSLGADAAAATAGRQYLYAFLPALVSQLPTAALGAALRAVGVVQAPTMIQVGSLVLNAVLAPVLIAGWGTGYPLGVIGAGLASSIAAIAGAVLISAMFMRMQSKLYLSPARMMPQRAIWARIFAIGLPTSGEFFIMFAIMGVTYSVIRDFGSDAQAGFGLGSRVMQAILMPAMAVAFAATPIAGQNFGAGRADRVRSTFRWSLAIGSIIMLLVLLVCQIVPEVIFRPFTDDPNVTRVAVEYFHIVSLNFPATGLVLSCSGIFQALGSTRFAFFAGLSRVVTFLVPAVWLSGLGNVRLVDFWSLSVASVVLQAIMIFWLLRREMRAKLSGLTVKSSPAT